MKKWSLVIHSVLFLLFVLLAFVNFMEPIDYNLQDRLYQKAGNPDARVVIIGIDDESLQILGRWPWPRDYHGELVRILSEGDPAVIALDIIFSEPSQDPIDDEYMVTMFAEAGNVVLPVYGAFETGTKRDLKQSQILQAHSLFEPFPSLKAVTRVGHINTIPDSDGLVRRTVLQFSYDGQIINSWAWNIYEAYLEKHGQTPIDISTIPVDPWHRTYINYAAEPFDIEMIPYHLVLSGDIDAEYFRDKIVFVGPYGVGMVDDYYFTPLSPEVPMYGVEIHANIVQQFLHERFMQDAPYLVQILILAALGCLGWFLFYQFRPGISALCLLVLLGGFLYAASIAGKQGYVVSLLYPIAFLSIQYVAALGHQFITEQLEKKRITDVFGKYVAPQIVGKILSEGEDGLKLGGSRREISCLFVDIRGFTPLSEAAQPEEVVSILNEYLTLCAQSIFDYDGTLDKFIGDATMAIFNAPFDVENHQLRAVQAAWAMQEGAKPLQEDIEKRFGKVVRFGVGIHTGPAVIGNIGAKFRMDYTAIGDTINTAARLESNSKPGQILISEEVYQHVKDNVEVTDLGTFQMKGKTQGIQVYQVDNVKNIRKNL